MPDGEDVPVTLDNVAEYIDAVVCAVVVDSVQPHVSAFLAGFAEVASVSGLRLFAASELSSLCSGDEQDKHGHWRADAIAASIKCEHGYSAMSPQVCSPPRAVRWRVRGFLSAAQILQLIEVMASLSPVARREFLQFLTGSPRLPVGGFRALRPRLTIVRAVPPPGARDRAPAQARRTKPVLMMCAATPRRVGRAGARACAGLIPDEQLPSCNTCVHFLKLPAYSTSEVLRDRLMYAIREGQNYFALD